MLVHTTKTNGRTVRMEEFGSFGEYINRAKDNQNPMSSNKDDRDGWSKTASLLEACSLAYNGWSEIRPDVDRLLNSLMERLDARFGDRYVTKYDVQGSFVDVGAFLQGVPECMVEFESEPAAAMGRVVRIVVAGTASSDIDPDDILRRGTAVVALIDCLHKMGLGVELWWDSTITGSDHNNHCTAVRLHDSAEPMDIDSIMFAVAHPSMLRRLTFSVQEQSETAEKQNARPYGGYGRPTDMGSPLFSTFDVKVERLQSGRGDIVQDPLGWVMSTVQGLGLAD